MSAILSADDVRQCGRDLPADFALALDDGRSLPVRRVLRHLPGRRLVVEVQQDDASILLKLFLHPQRAQAECVREREGLARLHAAGIPTQEVLGTLQTRDGFPALIARYHAGAHALGAVLPTGAGEPCPAALRTAFALVGQLHRHQWLHDDLHLNNFLKVSAGETAIGEQGDVLLLDGDAVQALGSEAARMENLVELCAKLVPAHWRAWCEALLAAYAGGLGRAAGEATALEAAVSAMRSRRLREYLHKCTRECSEFSVRREARQVRVARRDALPLLAGALDDPDQLLHTADILKDGGTCTVARVRRGGQVLALKRYNIKSLAHGVSRAWRPSRGWHSWLNAHRLTCLGIATPAPLAIIEERLGPLRRRAWLITQWQDGERLDQLIRQQPEHTLAPAVMAALASVLRELRAARLAHGDMKGNNFIWDGTQIVVIDLDAMSTRSAATYPAAWRKDRTRLAANWPADSAGRFAIEALLDALEREQDGIDRQSSLN